MDRRGYTAVVGRGASKQGGDNNRRPHTERYALYMLRDRLIAWEYDTRPGNNWFGHGQSFRDYAEPSTVSWHLVVPDAVT